MSVGAVSEIVRSTKMPSGTSVTFVVALGSRAIFENNFLASPCLRGARHYQILVQEGFSSAGKAYNDAIDKSSNDLIVICHADIILPENWLLQLDRALGHLETSDPLWGVLGCSGVAVDGHHWRYIYTSGLGISGERYEQPVAVRTLDEIVLVLRKSSGLRFDPALPHYHLYGTDICLRAAKRGMKSYSISAFCIHNTHQNLILAKEFYECSRYIRRAWEEELPIQTTCIRITKLNLPIYARRLREAYLRYIRRKEFGGTRTPDPQGLIDELSPVADRPCY